MEKIWGVSLSDLAIDEEGQCGSCGAWESDGHNFDCLDETTEEVPEIVEAYKSLTLALSKVEWLRAYANWSALVNASDRRLLV